MPVPTDDLQRARIVMLERNFSQLPVMSGPYVLKGVVSWQSIALAHAGGKCDTLADATLPAPEVSIEAELLPTIPDINRHNCVFVRDTDQKISGLVTAADLSLEFGRLTGPFLLLGEIERRLRRSVDRMCPTVGELRDATGYNKAKAPDDLTIGQIIRVFKEPERWARLNWELPHDGFVEKLDEIRRIRNDVAHFRLNPLTDDQRQQVRRNGEEFHAVKRVSPRELLDLREWAWGGRPRGVSPVAEVETRPGRAKQVSAVPGKLYQVRIDAGRDPG